VDLVLKHPVFYFAYVQLQLLFALLLITNIYTTCFGLIGHLQVHEMSFTKPELLQDVHFTSVLRGSHARVQFYGFFGGIFPLVPVCGNFRCVSLLHQMPLAWRSPSCLSGYLIHPLRLKFTQRKYIFYDSFISNQNHSDSIS
jgi:hypothetical protein